MTENEQIRKVLSEHPDLPVMLLTPSTPADDYYSYYHEGIEAGTEWILMPRKVEKATGSLWGLDEEKYYADESDADEDVAEWLFEGWYDAALRHAGRMSTLIDEAPGMPADDALTAYCGYEYDYEHDVSIERMAELLARGIVDDMPWQQYVVIKAALKEDTCQ